MTIALIGVSFILIFWPRTISAGNFRQILLLTGTTQLLAIYLTVGLARAVVLIGNGHLGRWGAIARATLSLFGAVIWTQLGAALWVQLPEPSPSIAVYGSLALGELWSIRRARRDDGGDS